MSLPLPLLIRSRPYTVVTGAFLVATLAVPSADRLLRPAPQTPEMPAEVAELLRQAYPALYVVPANGGSPHSGIYVSQRPLPLGRVVKLIRHPDFAHRWEGVVYCERDGWIGRIAPYDLDRWGEHGMRAGPLLFFGDPSLLGDLAPLVGAEGPGR
jgi:hypothetical protein